MDFQKYFFNVGNISERPNLGKEKNQESYIPGVLENGKMGASGSLIWVKLSGWGSEAVT